MRLYFVHDVPQPELWDDGLKAAIRLLGAHYEVVWVNLAKGDKPPPEGDHVLLAWGDFESGAESTCRPLKARVKALCMGGMVFSSEPIHSWDVVFAETEWHRASLATVRGHNRVRRAFGVNTDIYKPIFGAQKLFDWITVGAWALWKRQHLFADRPGFKLAVGGNYAARNTGEAAAIIDAYLRNNVIVAAYVPPPELARLYNASHACYIPAETLGGGERAVLEARACGIPVRVENDNPKLAELANGLVHSHHDYAAALRAGIEETLHG